MMERTFPSLPYGLRCERICLGIKNKYWQGHFSHPFALKCDSSNGNHIKMKGFLEC